jgi:hypothetical protein
MGTPAQNCTNEAKPNEFVGANCAIGIRRQSQAVGSTIQSISVNPSVRRLLIFLFLSGGVVLAQDELTAVPNRPTVSTPAQPVQPGVLESEWGLDAAASQQDINGLLKFGVSKNFELRVTNDPIIADSGTHGVGDSAVGFKYRFTQDSGYRPSFAFMYMVKVPTAGDVLGSGEVDHALTFLASKDLGKYHFDFNSVLIILGQPQGGFEHEVLNALAWSHPLPRKWGVTAEFSGVTSPNVFTSAAAQFLAAATYTMRPRLVLDCGMAARITGDIPSATFVAGFTYSIAGLYRGHSRPVADRRQP